MKKWYPSGYSTDAVGLTSVAVSGGRCPQSAVPVDTALTLRDLGGSVCTETVMSGFRLVDR